MKKFKEFEEARPHKEETEMGDAAHATTMKHRVLVTYSDPHHTASHMRKEKVQKHVLVPSSHKGESVYKGEAEELAKKHMKKQGYKVHEVEHVGLVTKKVHEEVEFQHGDKTHSYVSSPDQLRLHVEEGADSHYTEAEEHLNKASKALETSDMVAHHFHMSNHHEAKSNWHAAKGRYVSADREHAKAEEHHEKGLKAAGIKEESIDELSTDLLARYKEKASMAATAADKAKKYNLGHKRFKGIMKATFKQFANDAKK